jgi:malonyl-CoA/methylmalonyl-CoA synthetase
MSEGNRSGLIERRRQLGTTEQAAILVGGATYTHAAVERRAGAVARLLLGERATLGGARVGLLARPSIEWVAGFFGVIEAGGVVVPMSPQHPDPELLYMAGDAGIEALLTDRAHEGRAAGAPGARWLLEEAGEVEEQERPGLALEDGALLLYTSGTTGKPKGALLTHGNLEAQTRLLAEAWGITEQDRLLHTLPLHHMHGVVIALLTVLQAGASAELLPRFDPREVWEGFGRATIWMGVPTMYHRLLEALDRATTEEQRRWAALGRGLRLATSGSAALPATLSERWGELTGTIPLERFGMSELGVALSNPLAGPRRVGSVGRPLPGVAIQVVDGQGVPVPAGEAGELVVRGPTVFAGYLGREQATREAFREGWFLTGDTVLQEADGYLRILGRTSVDILKSGGYKLSALEIEEELRAHPGVAEVAVVGLPDEQWGERVAAVVVRKQGLTHPVTMVDLQAFCRERMAPYKIPRSWFFVEELPRNALGKVLKPALRQALQGTG